jgi:hypothetical protein
VVKRSLISSVVSFSKINIAEKKDNRKKDYVLDSRSLYQYYLEFSGFLQREYLENGFLVIVFLFTLCRFLLGLDLDLNPLVEILLIYGISPFLISFLLYRNN